MSCLHPMTRRFGEIITCVSCGNSRVSAAVERRFFDRIKSHEMHGGANTVEYRIWRGMISRCHDPMNKAWKRYGARGIVVCARWRASFAAFREDMGERPSSDHTIERVDNNGPYSPGNCKWATNHEQDRNKRTNVWVSFRGETKILTDWAKDYGLSPDVVRGRMRIGWPIERALTTPVGSKNLPLSEAKRHPLPNASGHDSHTSALVSAPAVKDAT